jgi:superfamily II DNA or RNA helicase
MTTTAEAASFEPGALVRARGREWVVLPESRPHALRLRPLAGRGGEDELILPHLEPDPPRPATFPMPDPENHGPRESARLLHQAMRMRLRAGAGPLRCFGNINFYPQAYQFVPLLVGLKSDPVRLLVADDVGIGKTIEAGLILREMLDRQEIGRTAVLCPPHLCEQWQSELASKFNIQAEIVTPGTVRRLERRLRADQSIFDVHPHTIVSLDYIKSDKRRDDFILRCPEFVIVEEAHASVRGGARTRHQRYELLKSLAAKDGQHMVFLTATPHSGDDEAFHNLLGLLDPQFRQLMEMPQGKDRDALRARLADHFVQRRRGDIKEWGEEAGLPEREALESQYTLSADWGQLFDGVIDYARRMVETAQAEGTKFQQRLSWWAALGLLRCISSSPAAAAAALRTRLERGEAENEADFETRMATNIADGDFGDQPDLDETTPAGTVQDSEESQELRELIAKAEGLRGETNDPKVAAVRRIAGDLVRDGYRPIIFCRYIATAHYVAEILDGALKGATVKAVTGEYTPDERVERVDTLIDAARDSETTPILVATDCLSEGINLQQEFNAVLHYDLSWNPTIHEQREGRVDRFGQPDKSVRTVMFYGQDNPVDGAILKVILRKAESIRRELGVSVPVPMDERSLTDAIMRTVLFQKGPTGQRQQSLDFGETEREVDAAWEKAKTNTLSARTNTKFAQRRLDPDDVIPEWRKATEALGGPGEVETFVKAACSRLGAGLDAKGAGWRLPYDHLPDPVKARLADARVGEIRRVVFDQPVLHGHVLIHRTHPLVTALAETVSEIALEQETPEVAARSYAVATPAVSRRTVLYHLRLRSRIVEQDKRTGTEETLLAEELVTVKVEGGRTLGAPDVLDEADVRALHQVELGEMDKAARVRAIDSALRDAEERLGDAFETVAKARADQVLKDHRRIRDAADLKGVTFQVQPSLPVDVLAVGVLLPDEDF